MLPEADPPKAPSQKLCPSLVAPQSSLLPFSQWQTKSGHRTQIWSKICFFRNFLGIKSTAGLELCSWILCCRIHRGIFSPDTRGAGAHQKQNRPSCLPGHEARGLRRWPAASSVKGRSVNVLSLLREVPTLSAEGGGSRRQWRMMRAKPRLSSHDPVYNRQCPSGCGLSPRLCTSQHRKGCLGHSSRPPCVGCSVYGSATRISGQSPAPPWLEEAAGVLCMSLTARAREWRRENGWTSRAEAAPPEEVAHEEHRGLWGASFLLEPASPGPEQVSSEQRLWLLLWAHVTPAPILSRAAAHGGAGPPVTPSLQEPSFIDRAGSFAGADFVLAGPSPAFLSRAEHGHDSAS
ncbi:uncharacterized protein LOC117094292 [Trachypithecus francoisi]|uniref:uncharacterized protein LOC117094292 n=1 Tax=Trachypithecus francoisi TaxID=54180 RepID=UPI00141AA338|nr:uncharacterized protein LOC117094292 [Trachypithecus francoisi]